MPALCCLQLTSPSSLSTLSSTLYKLLRCTCLHCFKLRMAGGEVERFRRRLQLLSQGRLVEAQNMVVGTSAAAKKAGACVGGLPCLCLPVCVSRLYVFACLLACLQAPASTLLLLLPLLMLPPVLPAPDAFC